MINQELITAISEMNMEELVHLLDERNSYQNTTKTIFLQKLRPIFEEFEKKDSRLIPYEGFCNASRERCDNCGKSGISFLGENSKKTLSLIMEESDNGDIKDMFSCSLFEVNDETVRDKISQYKRFDIIVYRDEMNDSFSSGKLYDECNKANQELLKYHGEILPITFIESWVNQYNDVSMSLNVFFDLNYKAQDLFYSIFQILDDYYQLLLLEPKAEQALKLFKGIKLDDDHQILEWLKTNYKLVCYIWNYNTSILEEKDSFGIKKINAELDISVDTNHLKNCIEFEQTYIQYSHLKEKYNIDIGDTYLRVFEEVMDRRFKINGL